MKVLDKCDDSYVDKRRVFYTIEVDIDKVVDIMVTETTAYPMCNHDGSTVYYKNKGNDYTCPNYEYNATEAVKLAISEYIKEYGGWR